MKIIHTSDIHIDSPLSARLPKDKIKQRRTELLGTMARLAEEARKHSARAVIIAGDLFDTRSVSKRAISCVLDAVASVPECDFFILEGNHDSGVLSAALKERGTKLENLHLFSDGIETYEIDGVTLTGIPECREGMFDKLSLPKDRKNIVIIHGELRDKSSAEGECIGITEARERNIDYIALGHYHSYSVKEIDSRGVAVYSGTPEGRGFDECGECGYVLIDTAGERVTHSFVGFAKRTLRIIPLPLDGAVSSTDIVDRAEALLADVSRHDLIRLELCGSYFSGLWKDEELLIKRFADRFYHFEVKDTSRLSVNPEDFKYDRTLKGEFIRTVYADESLDEKTKQKIVDCGIRALLGEK